MGIYLPGNKRLFLGASSYSWRCGAKSMSDSFRMSVVPCPQMESFGFEFILLSFQTELQFRLGLSSAPSTSCCRRTNKSWPSLSLHIRPFCWILDIPALSKVRRKRTLRNGCHGGRMTDGEWYSGWNGLATSWLARVSSLEASKNIPSSFLQCFSAQQRAVKLKVSNIWQIVHVKPPAGTFCEGLEGAADSLGVVYFALCVEPPSWP